MLRWSDQHWSDHQRQILLSVIIYPQKTHLMLMGTTLGLIRSYFQWFNLISSCTCPYQPPVDGKREISVGYLSYLGPPLLSHSPSGLPRIFWWGLEKEQQPMSGLRRNAWDGGRDSYQNICWACSFPEWHLGHGAWHLQRIQLASLEQPN